jgi:hypothetical protein
MSNLVGHGSMTFGSAWLELINMRAIQKVTSGELLTKQTMRIKDLLYTKHVHTLSYF